MEKTDPIKEKERQYALLQIYGSLLSPRQKEDISSYLGFDLSLSEISTELGISKAAISDSIHKAISNLEYFESKLHLYEKSQLIKEKINDIGKSKDEKEKLDLYTKLGKDIIDGI